jgi:hypothetical protein
MSRISLTIFVLSLSIFNLKGQTILFEDNFNDGISADWTLFNQDGLIPNAAVSEFDQAWISFLDGVDSAAASCSYYTTSGAANDYLITPKIAIGNFSKLVWTARSYDASFPDGYQVLISTTDSLPSSFTDTLLTVIAENATGNTRSIELDLEGYENEDVFIAFQNNTTNGYILILDDVLVLGAETAGVFENPISSISVFPNPTCDILQINSSESILNATIYSVSGQFISNESGNTIDVSRLEAGYYFLTIETVNGISSTSFVKN